MVLSGRTLVDRTFDVSDGFQIDDGTLVLDDSNSTPSEEDRTLDIVNLDDEMDSLQIVGFQTNEICITDKN
jgi:hypothetical protein